MRVTLVQTPLDWANPAANRQRMTRVPAPPAGATDLVVLPETFTTGFDMQGGASAELMGGATCEWLRAQARHLDAAVLGSAFIRDEAGVHNRALWATPDGTLVHYDKRHLFRMGGEHECYAAGLEPLLVSWRGACIAPLICYDLRFPELFRSMKDVDIIVLPSAFTETTGRMHWDVLVRARAIENLAYVIASAQGGYHINGRETHGNSMIVDPWGRVLDRLPRGSGVVIGEVNPSYKASLRKSLPALSHRILYSCPQ